jgi:hypothetical protein
VSYAVLDFQSQEKEESEANTTSKEERLEVYGNAATILNSVVVPRSAVELFERIDGGQFGDVFRGTLHRGGEVIPAAIKAVRMESVDQASTQAFLEESSTMAQLTHQNVVQLIAIVADPLLLVMELITEGSVLSYVRAHPNPPVPVILQIAMDTGAGLRYLHEHKLIHRDVAARYAVASLFFLFFLYVLRVLSFRFLHYI